MLGAHRDIAGRLTVEINETVALGRCRGDGALHARAARSGLRRRNRRFRRRLQLVPQSQGARCRHPQDRRLVLRERLAGNPDNQYFVRSLIEMAREIRASRRSPNGLQTAEDAEYLRKWGVDYLQGNLFGAASVEIPWTPSANPAERGSRAALPVEDDVPAAPTDESVSRPNLDDPNSTFRTCVRPSPRWMRAFTSRKPRTGRFRVRDFSIC